MLRTKNQHGFTIIELMIAVSALSLLLLLCTMGIIRLSQTYYKGIIGASTQQTARTTMDSITQTVQFGGVSSVMTNSQTVTDGPANYDVKTICIGQQRYSYAPNYQQIDDNPDISQKQLKHGFWQDIVGDPSNCSGVKLHVDNPSANPIDGTNIGSEGRELLGNRMRLIGLSIEKCSGILVNPCSANGSETLYRVTLSMMYGDSDMIDSAAYNAGDTTTWPNVQCRAVQGFLGSAFCAKSELSSVIRKRLR